MFSTPSVFPGGMDSTLSCLLSQDIQLPGHDLSLSGINLFFLFFLVNVHMALFLSLGKFERLELLPPRGQNKSVKLMIYQRMSVYNMDVGSKVS